jgi:hypothetical protein
VATFCKTKFGDTLVGAISGKVILEQESNHSHLVIPVLELSRLP